VTGEFKTLCYYVYFLLKVCETVDSPHGYNRVIVAPSDCKRRHPNLEHSCGSHVMYE